MFEQKIGQNGVNGVIVAPPVEGVGVGVTGTVQALNVQMGIPEKENNVSASHAQDLVITLFLTVNNKSQIFLNVQA